jgi:hypothetical protein
VTLHEIIIVSIDRYAEAVPQSGCPLPMGAGEAGELKCHDVELGEQP